MTRQVYVPYRRGIPNLPHYYRELLGRLDFAKEMSDTNIRATNTNTLLGQAWLVFNPLLMAAVYYLLVVVLRAGSGKVDFAQIAGGLFLFFLVSGIIQACTTAVTNAGSLILNMKFPKQLLIVANVYLALRRFVPTMLVYMVIHLLWRMPLTLHLLWVPLVVVSAALIGMGIGSFTSTWQVYFRDTANFLPHLIRIWLYASPVLYSVDLFMAGPIGKRIGDWILVNPAFGMLSVWSDVLHGLPPTWYHVVAMCAWALVLSVGGVLYFISKERDFAVRL